MKQKSFFIATVFSVLIHFFSLAQYILQLYSSDLYYNWIDQFIFLLVISLFLTIIIPFCKKSMLLILIFLFRLGIYFIITVPMGDYIGIKLSLLCAILIDLGIYISFPKSLFTSLSVIIITLYNQHPVNAWGKELSSVSAHDLISLAMYSLIIMFCVNAINFLLKKYIDKENLARRMDKAVLHLTSANVGFQRYMRIVEEQSIINERNRITRELHDSIGYTLTNLIMLMEAAIRMKKEDFDELQLLNKKARDHAKEGFKEIRGALHSIRSMEMEKVKGITAIQKLITVFKQATGMKVDVEYCNLRNTVFSEEINVIIYRFIQEGMTNAFRHGNATHIRVNFWQDNSKIIVNIQDNGSGCNEVKEGMGLIGMRERLKHIGGKLSNINVTNGFLITAWIPWNPQRL